ncbi:MAG: hypothetical protein V2A72_05245 [Candidatus Omnitrophota bacterium]
MAPALFYPKTNYFSILAIALLIVTGTVIYSNTFHSPFQFDDEVNIYDNFAIRNISDLKAIWNFFPTRFITYLSISFNYHLGRFNVLGYHIFNLFIHLSSAITIWWLAAIILQTPALRDNKISAHSDTIALFTGLIFVSHPIQTQAVTYIIQRTASLAALLYILSLAFYIKSRLSQYEKDKSRIRFFYYALSFIALVTAMFSKEMTITLPLMILLSELFFFRGRVTDWKPVIPFFAALLIIPVTMAATKSVDFHKMRLMREPGPGILPLNYLLTQFRVIVTYIKLLLVPVNQNLDYD